MKRARVCVAKIGGSVLATADVPRRLRDWLAAETADHADTHYVLVVGGGKMVDAVRKFDEQSPLATDAAHWICVELMDVTARLVGTILPELTTVDQFARLEVRLSEPGTTLLRPSEFLKQVEPSQAGARLVADWSVTSDSIAGRLAIVLAADELVLVKSRCPPIDCGGTNGLCELAAARYVDEFLPKLAAELPAVRFVDLSSGPRELQHRTQDAATFRGFREST